MNSNDESGQLCSGGQGPDPDQATEVAARRDDEGLRRDHPVIWWATLIGPLILTVLILFVVLETSGGRGLWRLVSTAVTTFFLFGKFVILGGTDENNPETHVFFSAEQLMAIVLYMDAVVACVLSFHLGFVFRLPVVGPKLRELVDDGQFILQSNPWMKRATFFGLVAFVMFPLAATGSVGGSIFGRLLGISATGTLAGIMLGNVLGCGLMYFGSELITRYVGRDNPFLLVGGIVVIGGILLVLNHRYRQLKTRRTTGSPRS